MQDFVHQPYGTPDNPNIDSPRVRGVPCRTHDELRTLFKIEELKIDQADQNGFKFQGCALAFPCFLYGLESLYRLEFLQGSGVEAFKDSGVQIL